MVTYLEGRLARAVSAQQAPRPPSAPPAGADAPRPLTLPIALRTAIADYNREVHHQHVRRPAKPCCARLKARAQSCRLLLSRLPLCARQAKPRPFSSLAARKLMVYFFGACLNATCTSTHCDAAFPQAAPQLHDAGSQFADRLSSTLAPAQPHPAQCSELAAAAALTWVSSAVDSASGASARSPPLRGLPSEPHRPTRRAEHGRTGK